MHEDELAWALIERVRPQLSRTERNHIFTVLGAGDTFLTMRLLLKLIAAKGIMVGPDIFRVCSMWLEAYAAHEAHDSLRLIIDGFLIGDGTKGPPVRKPSAAPNRRPLLTVHTRRLPLRSR